MKPFLEFLTKPGCHLCDRAWPAVERAAALSRADVRRIDIRDDAEMAVDFGLRIPVVRWQDGTVLAEGHIELPGLLGAILRRRLSPRRRSTGRLVP